MVQSDAQDEPDAATAWRRTRRSMRRLFDDLADLDEAGGLAVAARSGAWSDARLRRAAGHMNLLRRMLKHEVDRT